MPRRDIDRGDMPRIQRIAQAVTVWVVALIGMTLCSLTGCNGQLPGGIPATDGTYPIGVDYRSKVYPGTYRSTSGSCRWKIGGDRPRSGRGPSTVYLNADHDAYITVRGCGSWIEVRR